MVKDGRLPLHLASDPTTLQVLEKNTRYELVYDIWKAYPEAASVTDPLTSLPPFALAARQGGKKPSLAERIEMNLPNVDDSISSSFFLLRQYPEILSEYDVSNSNPDMTLSQIIKGRRGIKSSSDLDIDDDNSNAKRQKSSGLGINLTNDMSYERFCQLKELNDSD